MAGTQALAGLALQTVMANVVDIFQQEHRERGLGDECHQRPCADGPMDGGQHRRRASEAVPHGVAQTGAALAFMYRPGVRELTRDGAQHERPQALAVARRRRVGGRRYVFVVSVVVLWSW